MIEVDVDNSKENNDPALESVDDIQVSNDFEDNEVPTPRHAQEEVSTEIDSDLEAAQNFEDAPAPKEGTGKKLHHIPIDTFKEASPTADASMALPIPTMTVEAIVELLQAAEKISRSLTREQAEAITVHAESAALTPPDGVYDRFFENSESLTNRLRSPSGVDLGQSIPQFKPPVAGQVLNAEDASAYLARLKKTYDYIYISAIHSGMWLKVQVPTLKEIHNLMGMMASHRNQLGYETRGATLSCDGALRNMIFIDWLIDRTVKTNMVDSDPAVIRRNLMATDIPLLAQQMASTLHPSGYLTERACTSKPGVCNHVERAIVRLSKMIFTDTSRLTEKQYEHMQTLLRSQNAKTEKDMATYRAEFGKTILREVELSPIVRVTFTPPSIETYATVAEEWATEIKRSSEEIISAMTEMEARQHLQDQARLGVLTKYAAWVESINLNGSIVQDQVAIRTLLAQLSEDDDIVGRFTDSINNYISECTVAAVGVNDYSCPVCKGKQAQGTTGITASIAAIDPINAFFTLAQLKIQRSLARDSAL